MRLEINTAEVSTMLLRSITMSALAGALCLVATPASAQSSAAPPTSAQATSPARESAATVQKQKPTDDEIDDRVEFRLDTSDVVRKYNVHTKVQAGVVTL